MIKDKVFQIERPWGNFRQFTHNESSTIKIITIKPNEILSLQTHSKRAEFWHIISGDGIIQIKDQKINVKVGDEFEIGVGDKHRMSAGSNGMQVLEISIGDFDEEDIIHFEDKYGRS
jgi:mannose-1-phosphate guanylyltransferase/mannose-1-phosphate guanylyltransferase/mannose-6-phosphate isomerase